MFVFQDFKKISKLVSEKIQIIYIKLLYIYIYLYIIIILIILIYLCSTNFQYVTISKFFSKFWL